MDYPAKFVAVLDGVVVGFAILYYENSSFTGPEGSETFNVHIDSPVVVGWRRIFDEDTETWNWFPPLPTPSATAQGDAGNGNPPPPG